MSEGYDLIVIPCTIETGGGPMSNEEVERTRRMSRRIFACLIVTTVLVGCGGDDLPIGSPPSSTAASATRAADTTVAGTAPSATGAAGNFTFSTAPFVEPATASNSDPSFPLRPSNDGNTLIDQGGEPFLVVGDAAWSMLVQLDLDQTDAYLKERKDEGFNTLLVNLIEHKFSDDPPRNTFGDEPFLKDGDFSRPNPAYFDAAHAALERAASMGFLVLLAPAYLGYQGGDEGWYQEMVDAGPDALRSYGRFVGERFADLDNIIWVQGGDFTPPSDDLDLVEAVRDGLIEGGALQLHTAHWSPETSATDVEVDWLDLNTTYTYGPVYVKSSADDQIADLPHLVIESQYEDDQFDNTAQRLRSQAYEAVLTGAIGSVFGNGPIWQFADGWESALGSQGGREFAIASEFFRSLPLADLTSDVAVGNVVPDPGDFGEDDFIVAASSPTDVVAYVPTERDVSAQLSGTSGRVTVRWFDPTNGEYVKATGVTADGGLIHVPHPGKNAGGDFDWIVRIQVTDA